MERIELLWMALVLGSLIAGASIVGVLVLRKRAEPIAALVGLAAFGLSASSFVSMTSHYGRVDAALYGFAFIVASVGGGYALASSMLTLLAREPEQPAPAIAGEADLGPAVVLLACAEAPVYDPVETGVMLQRLADEDLISASTGTLPFLFFAQKARYRAIGNTSESTRELEQIAETLAASLPDWPTVTATCSGDAYLPLRVRDLAQKGHRPIVVAELSVAEPPRMVEAKRSTDALRLADQGVEVRYTGELAHSDRIVALVAERIMGTVDDPGNTGVVLVGHGQPEEGSHANPAYDESENRFLNRIRLTLTERGLLENNLRVAWAEWRNPNVTSSVRHLAALGCQRIVVSPAVYPLDGIATRLDLDISVRQARVEDAVSVITLSGWHDDPLLAEELRARVVGEATRD